MKRTSLALLMCIIVSFAAAVITDYYAPPVASAGSYTAITGTFPGYSGDGWPSDEELSQSIPIGFTFNYCGVPYTTAKMSTNGYLAMGSNHNWFYSYENMLSSTDSSYYPFIAPLWDDMDCAGLSYETTGEAPNRVFTAQWANAMWDYSGTPGQNFQVKLYETSDKIELIYGTLVTPSYPSATIGINMAPGGANNFYSITPGNPISYSTVVENNNITSIANLTSGTTYTFNRAMATVPNPALAVYPANGATSIPIAANLIWASGGGLPTGYRLNFGSDGGGVTPPTNIASNLNLAGNTTYDPAGNLATNTTYYWQIVPYNASGSATGCPIWSFSTGGLPLRGEKTIDPAGSGPDNYISFTAAITDLNSVGVGQDGVIFYVPAGLVFNEPAILPPIATTGTLSNPITFMKLGAGANPLVTVPGTPADNDYVFKFAGVDYVTFDGIDVANFSTGTSVEYGFILEESTLGGGCMNNTVQNSAITLSRNNAVSKGIYSSVAKSPNSYNSFINLNITDAYYGIWLSGMEYMEDVDNVIQGCVFNSIAEYNMNLEYQSGIDVLDNVINYPTSEPCAGTIYGIQSYSISGASIYNNTFSGGTVSRSITNVLLNYCADVEIHHNTISGTVTTAPWWIGIYASLPRWGTLNIHHNSIHDITTGMINWAIYTMRGYDININDNEIYNITTGMVFWGIHAIEHMSLDDPANIYNNKIYNILITGDTIQMVSGINVQDIFANVYNNMVYNIKAPNTTFVTPDPQVCGISLQDMQPTMDERANVYNNTVLLDATGSSNSSTSAFFSSFAGPVDMKNNIFMNHSTPGATGKAVAFWKRGTTFDNYLASMDKNIYFAGTPSPSHLVFYDGTNSAQSLAEYKLLNIGKDQGSYYEDVPFVSAIAPYDLHINPTVGTNVESNAIYLSTVVIDDIDGDIRSLTPDIGADEGDFTALSGLGIPENVIITVVGANVEISWDEVAGATGYYVYGSNDPTGVMPWGTPLQSVVAPFTSVTLSPAAQYQFYYVTAHQ